MTYYEIKKIFARKSSKLSFLVLGLLLAMVVYFLVADEMWVNENGDDVKGFSAIHKIREAKQEWAGTLDEEKIGEVIAEINRIKATPEGNSDEIPQQNIAFSWMQGLLDIRYLLCYSYGGFLEFDYLKADTLTPDMAGAFYENRLKNLEEWFVQEGSGASILSEEEKAFLVKQYQEMEQPLFYEYQEGWLALFQWFPAVIMLTTMVIGFLCARIFSDEFRLKTDAIFYSSYHGRKKAVLAKMKAGFLILSGIYWAMILLYSAIILGIYGAEGANCPIQSTMRGWKSFYNITNLQEYLLVVLGGYVGCLFMVTLVMLVSAAVKSSLLAVTVPFILIVLPSFVMGINTPLLNKILGLFPDQLLQMTEVVKYFNLYEIGGKVYGAAGLLFVVYLIPTLLLVPVIYQSYRKKQIL